MILGLHCTNFFLNCHTTTLSLILLTICWALSSHCLARTSLGSAIETSGHFSVYRPHLSNYALEIPKNRNVNELWTAGFYFNSAIQRIAAAFDRIPQMLGAKGKRTFRGKRVSTSAKERMTQVNPGAVIEWQRVYDEVNVFKHDPKGRAPGRTVRMSDAAESFEQIIKLLNANKLRIANTYK